jgi:SulP family sulfate permease
LSNIKILPNWLLAYRKIDLGDDIIAGVITAILLVPQGMAYAVLAGLPPELGLYASIIPPLIYAFSGSSRTIAIGPVSVAAILVASAMVSLGKVPGTPEYIADVVMLTALCGAMLITMAFLRLGGLSNFLSHPVLNGFTSAAAIIIIISQIKNLTGLDVPRGESIFNKLSYVVENFAQFDSPTFSIGLACILGLVFLKPAIERLSIKFKIDKQHARALGRTGPLFIVVISTAVVFLLKLDSYNVSIVGNIPSGFPEFSLGFIKSANLKDLIPSAIIITIIAYVETVSIAKVLANRSRQKIYPNQEMMALGLSNLGSAVIGSMPIAGGFSRSMVNFTAGAKTQLASIVTALLVAVVAIWFTPYFYYMPHATLAAIIIMAVIPLIDIDAALSTWRYDKGDFSTLFITFSGVLLFDLETGLILGVLLSLGIHQWKAGHPHVAIVGRVPETEHYRNVLRHQVESWPELLLIRIDESLYFANIAYLQDVISSAVIEQPDLKHLVLICSAVNRIDHSALESLEKMTMDLKEAGISLHLAEVKGPVMDHLRQSDFLYHMQPGKIFLSTNDAVKALTI